MKTFPRPVQHDLGQALESAQFGVLELVEDHDGNTYRDDYTVKCGTRVYVLHAFRKKSEKGIKTPMHVIDLIKARLREAEGIHAELEAGK